MPGIEDSFPASKGELQIGGVPVSRIAEEFGTPLFVYDEAVLQRKWDLLRASVSAALRNPLFGEGQSEPEHSGIFPGARRWSGNRFGR